MVGTVVERDAENDARAIDQWPDGPGEMVPIGERPCSGSLVNDITEGRRAAHLPFPRHSGNRQVFTAGTLLADQQRGGMAAVQADTIRLQHKDCCGIRNNVGQCTHAMTFLSVSRCQITAQANYQLCGNMI
jgi:hypothetical protein